MLCCGLSLSAVSSSEQVLFYIYKQVYSQVLLSSTNPGNLHTIWGPLKMSRSSDSPKYNSVLGTSILNRCKLVKSIVSSQCLSFIK